MKRPSNNQKKSQKKSPGVSTINNTNKKTIPIDDNNNTILNFFKVSSLHKSTTSNVEQKQTRQDLTKLNKDKTESQKNNRLSRYHFYESKKKKSLDINKLMKVNNEENRNKIDVSNYILFSENFNEQINNIFTNNFIRNFKRFLENDFETDKKTIRTRQNLNITKNSFNKFIQGIFNHFLIKYLLNQYPDLIYVPTKYMLDKNNRNDYSEIGLLSHNDKSNIYLEYSPINLNETNLYYPDLTSKIVKFIRNFRKKKHKKKENHALLLYRPNNDFTSFINKLRLICYQLGYNLLIKEDEANKSMNFEKLKLINQNYIIGSLKDKNKKYLQIINNIAVTDKWKNFLAVNNINLKEQKDTNKSNQNLRSKNISKSQSSINTTQAISKKILQNKNRNKINDALSNTLLTFIGHSSSNEIESQENNSNSNNSSESIIARNYQQNILEKFNKRKNVILFLDNFEENEENMKYINQINGIIPTSKSPIIILTNNLYFFSNNLSIGNSTFQTRYMPYQIENEGVSQKENVIYTTFLIIYLTSFFPKAVIEKQNTNEIKIEKNKEKNDQNNVEEKSNDKEKEKEKEIENDPDFVIHIKDDENDDNENEDKNYDYNLDKIKNVINKIFIDVDLNTNLNKLYRILLSLSYIISIINQYELDNVLVYLKNLFQFIEPQLNNIHVKPNVMNTLSLIQNTILKDVEEYKIEDSEISTSDEDISKVSEMLDNDSFNDYECGNLNRVGEKEYEEKLKYYEINKDVDYNKESYFYINKFVNDKNNIKKFNYISNKEIEERIIEDHKFFQEYYNSSNANFNYSDIIKINMILIQIIMNESISLEDTSRFMGVRFSKRNNKNNDIKNEKIVILNRIFRKCPLELFSKYINAHIGVNYYTEFIFDNKKYYLPEKLIFYNYYNDFYLLEKIQSEQKSKYAGIEDDDDDENDFICDEESELIEEEDEY